MREKPVVMGNLAKNHNLFGGQRMTKKYIKDITAINRLYEVEFDGSLYYQIAHTKKGAASTFEHDYTLVERVESYIKEHGRSLILNKGRLVFSKAKDGTPALALASFLQHCYYGLSIEYVRSAKVQHIGGKYLSDGSEDCRKQSLVHMSGVQYKTYNREFRPVTIGGVEFVELRMNSCIWPVLLNNDPQLVDLLADTNIFNNFHLVENGVQVQFREAKDGVRDYPYIHQIACAVRKGLLTRENFTEWDSIFAQMTEDGRLQVDHLDADKFNNTYQNLSLMDGGVNDGKKGYTAADFGRYLTAWAYDWDSDVYLVEVTTDLLGKGRVQQHYRCSNEWELLSCIENMTGRDKMTNSLTHITTVGAGGQLISVPLPGRAFAEKKSQYKANGGKGKYPKIESNTIVSIENGARLLALYKSNPEKFAPWPNTRGGISMRNPAEGVSAILRMIGARVATD